MDDETEWMLVSELVANVPPGAEWPGSVVRWCSICGEPIYLSREAIARLEAEPKMRPWCAACATPHMRDAAKANDGKINVRQVDPRGAPLRPVLDYLKRAYGDG
jgi:hypothetical protein